MQEQTKRRWQEVKLWILTEIGRSVELYKKIHGKKNRIHQNVQADRPSRSRRSCLVSLPRRESSVRLWLILFLFPVSSPRLTYRYKKKLSCSCPQWKQNGFCTSAFYSDQVGLCPETCGLCVNGNCVDRNVTEWVQSLTLTSLVKLYSMGDQRLLWPEIV